MQAVKAAHLAVRTEELRHIVQQQHRRELHCVFVPCWLLASLLAILAAWMHSQPNVAAASELSLTSVILAGADPGPYGSYPVSSPADVLPWVRNGLLPLLQRGQGDTAVPHLKILGGLRISAVPTSTYACPASTSALLSKLGLVLPCTRAADDETGILENLNPASTGRWLQEAGTRQPSGANMGDLNAAMAFLQPADNSTPTDIAAVGPLLVHQLGCAFKPMSESGAGSWLGTLSDSAAAYYAGSYHAVFPAVSEPAGVDTTMAALEAGAWLGPTATSTVRVQAAGISASSSRWMSTAWDFQFVPGGTVVMQSMAASLPVDAASAALWPSSNFLAFLLPLLDLCAILLAVVLTVQGITGALHTTIWLSSKARRSVLGLPDQSQQRRYPLFSGLVWALDLLTGVILLVAITAWGDMSRAVDNTAEAAALYATALTHPVDPAQGAACYGSPSASSEVGSATLQLHALLNTALHHQATWRRMTGAVVALLVLRVLRMFTLQPHTAILLDCVVACFTDLSHFGAVFILLLLGFATWGSLAFGAQVSEFNTLPTGLFMLVRMAMFDYDLGPLQSQDGVGGSAFFTFFMLGMTHLVLWTWLGIAMEAYSTQRNAIQERPALPTLLQDATAGLRHPTQKLWDCTQSARNAVRNWRATAAALNSWSALGTLQLPHQPGGEQKDRTVLLKETDCVPRSLMLVHHARVLAAVCSHAGATLRLDELAAALGVTDASARAVLQYYVTGDDISTAARLQLVHALAGSESPDPVRAAQLAASSREAQCSAPGGTTGSSSATASASDAAFASSGGLHLSPLHLGQVDVWGNAGLEPGPGAASGTVGSVGAAVGIEEWGAGFPAGVYSGVSTPALAVPPSLLPAGQHPGGSQQYYSVRGMMVRRASTSAGVAAAVAAAQRGEDRAAPGPE